MINMFNLWLIPFGQRHDVPVILDALLKHEEVSMSDEMYSRNTQQRPQQQRIKIKYFDSQCNDP